MAVLAHPDDETVLGPLLARYASQGHQAWVVSVTSGQIGVTPNTTLPAGPELGRAREEELRRACGLLGIHPPLLLGFEDGGIHTHRVQEEIAERLRHLFAELRPDVVLTWGPEGASGHPDHRALSAITTQVFQTRPAGRHSARKLYYIAYPESLFRPPVDHNPALEKLLRALTSRPVFDDFISTAVDCRDYTRHAAEALRCHRTQWDDALMDAWTYFLTQVLGGHIYLRLALPPAIHKEDDILAGLDPEGPA